MTRSEFRKLAASRPLLLDGATGTEFVKRGMPGGVCPEMWALEHPEAVASVQHAYRDAGSDIVYIPSFGGNRAKLQEYGLQDRVAEINRRLAEISVANMPETLMFGDIAPTGRFVEPFGDLAFEDAVAIFREQAQALKEGGAAGFVIETMLDIQEARAALLGIREAAPDMPVMMTLTFDESGRTLTGCDPVAALITAQSLGADAFGCNCSTGPEQMIGLIRKMKPYAEIPLIAKPNAGMPKLQDGKTVFDLMPEDFGRQTAAMVEAGASIVGGCCGTSPAHIAALHKALAGVNAPEIGAVKRGMTSSPRKVRRLAQEEPFAMIGERINPTGKKKLQAALKAGDWAPALAYAEEQTALGAALLDVNCGMAGIDEKATLRTLVAEISRQYDTPLCIDTTHADAAEAALRLYPGRALFNSVSAERNRLEKVLPIAAKYGAMLILLPLTDEGIPATLEGRIQALNTILTECAKYGIKPEDCAVDALVMTVSAEQEAAERTLALIDYAANTLKMNTVCGLSNVSFGLPRRELVNAAFLGMALGRGLNMAIVNPASPMIVDMIHASDVLSGRDDKMRKYLALYGNTEGATMVKPAAVAASLPEQLRHAVLKGDDTGIGKIVQAALDAGHPAQMLVDDVLIPAITEVGDLFDRKEYFLPQLVQSADAMRNAMSHLLPHLQSSADSGVSKPGIILATVKGDIHDIGKNIVALMLQNYGFEVLDLGKDVPADVILDAAMARGIKLIGLSALMTTTMTEMDNVIKQAQSRGMDDLTFIVGGAVLSEDYASKIGAFYAKDAMETVKIAKKFTNGVDKA